MRNGEIREQLICRTIGSDQTARQRFQPLGGVRMGALKSRTVIFGPR